MTYYSEFRKSFTAKIVHRCDESEAKLILPQRFAKFASELPNGMSYVKDAYGATELLRQALITSRDIELIAHEHPPSKFVPPMPGDIPRRTRKLTRDLTINNRAVVNADKRPERPLEQGLIRLSQVRQIPFETQEKRGTSRLNVSDPLQQQILRLARSGMSRRKIKDQLGLHGAKYEIVRKVLDEYGL